MDEPNAAKDEVWRLFVAIDLPEEVKQRALHVRRTLEEDGWRARWVRPEALHLSLRFYGNQPVDSVPGLSERLQSWLVGTDVFELRTTGVGLFPNRRRPRVIWLGVSDHSHELHRIADMVERASRAYGIEPETRAFRPHITLARLRPEEIVTIRDGERQFNSVEQPPSISFRVDHISLIHSDLRREGPVYTVVERIDLGN